MKKVVSYLLSLLIMVQCFCIVPFNAFANESEKYSICYTKFVLSDNSTEYTQSIIRDDYLMVDVQWLCDKLGLKYRKFNTLTGTSGAANNYFMQRTNLMSSEFFNNGFSVSKPDSDFSFIFQAGNKEAVALSGYLGSYSVNLGTKVTPVTDENGNVSHYVPLFAFCEIFNVAYDICTEPEKNYIVLPEPNITAIDILHMQNKLSEYKMQNCLVDAINDDLLSFLGMALGESLSNTIDSIVSLKLANLVDPTKDNYDILALQMCSSDTDEVDKVAAYTGTLNNTFTASPEIYSLLTGKVSNSEFLSSKKDMYREILQYDNGISLSEFEKYYKEYENVCKIKNVSDLLDDYTNLSVPMLFTGLSLIFETASAQDNYLKFMNTYFEYADETLSKEEKMGYNYIQDRMKIYESSFDDAWTLLSDEDMFSNITTFAAEKLTGLQLGKLGLAATAGKWGVNLITGGAFDFNDIYYNCMVNQEFQKSSQKVVTSYFNESDFDLDTYRALEWTRLKSYYVANENEIELYKQYYETSKFNADINPTLNMLYDVGFGKKEKYSDAELEEFAKKVFEFAEELPEDEIYKKFGIEIDFMGSIDLNGIIIPEAAFEDYNMMIESKKLLDSESKKIDSDTEELAEYMAVLLYGADGTTPENVKNCESFAAESNKWVLENNYALYQPVEGKVVESEEKTPVEGAEVIFKSDKGDSIICTTDDDGNVLGLDETIINSFADDINGNKNTQGILEENDPEKQENAFSQYEPNIKYSTVELYLPLGSYSLDIKASGYKDYEHEETIEIKIGEKCELGEILLEIKELLLSDLAKMKMSEIIELMDGEYSAESWLDGFWYIRNDEVFPNISFCVQYENYSDPLYAKYGESALDKKLKNDEISLDAIEVKRSTTDSSNYMITDTISVDFDYIQCAEILGAFSCHVSNGGWIGGTAEAEAYSFEENGCDITLHFYNESISDYIMNGVDTSASVMQEYNPQIYKAVISPYNHGIKENTVYYGGWYDGDSTYSARYTKEFILVDNKIEIEVALLMGSLQTVTFEISEISGNTYYLKNGIFHWQTESANIDDGKITVNDDGSFDITYSVSGNQCQDHFVLE